MRFHFVLMLLLALVVQAEEKPSTSISKREADSRTAYHMTDGKCEALIVPAIGRVMYFGRVGDTNWLWNAPAGQEDQDGWKNFGGEKAWISPEGHWPMYTGRGFPPDEAWEGGHTAEILDNPARLRTTSPVGKNGIRIIREFCFNEAGEFVTQTTLEQTEDKSVLCGAWTVTQIPPTNAVFLPSSPASAYQDGFYNWIRKPIGNIVNAGNIQDTTLNLVRVIPTTAGAYKIGVDSQFASIAVVRNAEAFVQRSERKEGNYPDGAIGSGFPVELYDHGNAERHYLEIEMLSPLALLKKGQQLTFKTRWSLHKLPTSELDFDVMKKAISKLLKE